MKIVVIKSPKLLSSFFRMVFRIKKEPEDIF
ncbi:MAG: stage V sporulation protein SpoVM [Oscillospiraceae bacterium]|nr:stage V sporulation protein SpoVM [Oscillospiraceae bacterium]